LDNSRRFRCDPMGDWLGSWDDGLESNQQACGGFWQPFDTIVEDESVPS